MSSTPSQARPPMDEQALRRRLGEAGLLPTAKRVALGRLIFRGEDRHFSAEDLWRDAAAGGMQVSVATIYNTLNSFVGAGLLRTVDMSGARTLFDTNTTPHHHVVDARTGSIRDLDVGAVTVQLGDGALPEGVTIEGIDVLVRVR